MTLLYYDPRFLDHVTGRHPERPQRIKQIGARLEQNNLAGQCARPEWQEASRQRLERVHSSQYIDYVNAFARRGGGMLDPDTVVSPASAEVARLAAGAACDALDRVLGGEDRTALCLGRPPGHHATRTAFGGSCYLNNELARGEMELAGEKLSLAQVECDTYIVAAQNDHIAPWRSSSVSTQLLGGDVRFCLSSRGHIAGVVNPPSPKAKIWPSANTPPDPDVWWEQAKESHSSWWEDWTEWIDDRAGGMVDARDVGSTTHPPIDVAPGQYVRAKAS